MRCLLLLALAACATDPPPPQREPPPPLVRDYRAPAPPPPTVTVRAGYESDPRSFITTPEQVQGNIDRLRAAALAEEQARQARAAEAKRLHDEQAARELAQHTTECKATFITRLKSAQGLLATAAAKKAQIVARCRNLQGHCAISGEHSACVGIGVEDTSFFQNTCMMQAYWDQQPMFDESGECADVDTVKLSLSLDMPAAEVAAIRNAKP